MDWSAIWTMTMADLRQRIRDKSVLVFGLIVPLALMFVFNLLFSGFDDSPELEPITVGMASAGDQQLPQTLVQVFAAVDAMQVEVVDVDADDLASAVEDGAVDVGLAFPDDFDDTVMAGGSPVVEGVDAGNGSLEGGIVLSITQGWVDQLATTSQAAVVAAAQDPAAIDSVVAALSNPGAPTLTVAAGQASDQQLSQQGYLVAGQAALFVFFTVGFGVIGYVYEREQGTLPRLESMPIPPRSIIIAKALVSFLLGVGATGVLLLAGTLLFGVDFGAAIPVAVLVVALVAAVTSLVMLVIRVVRTAEQAQIANSIIGLVLGVLGGSFFPLGGNGWLTRLSDLTPPAAFIRGLGITNGGGGVSDLGPPLAVLAGFLVVSATVGLLLPRREMA